MDVVQTLILKGKIQERKIAFNPLPWAWKAFWIGASAIALITGWILFVYGAWRCGY